MVVDVIKRFSEGAPAAMLFRGLFARIFSDERMNEIFREHKQLLASVGRNVTFGFHLMG